MYVMIALIALIEIRYRKRRLNVGKIDRNATGMRKVKSVRPDLIELPNHQAEGQHSLSYSRVLTAAAGLSQSGSPLSPAESRWRKKDSRGWK